MTLAATRPPRHFDLYTMPKAPDPNIAFLSTSMSSGTISQLGLGYSCQGGSSSSSREGFDHMKDSERPYNWWFWGWGKAGTMGVRTPPPWGHARPPSLSGPWLIPWWLIPWWQAHTHSPPGVAGTWRSVSSALHGRCRTGSGTPCRPWGTAAGSCRACPWHECRPLVVGGVGR